MTNAKRLLAEATPLPWFDGGDIETVALTIATDPYATGPAGSSFQWSPNKSLILHAVNRLPDYLAAVEAATALVNWINEGGDVRMYPNASRLLDLRAILARLRDEVPA